MADRIILTDASRFKNTQLIKDDGVIFFDIWKSPDSLVIDEILFEAEEYDVRSTDIGRLDLLADRFYDDERLHWLIALANAFIDPIAEMFVGQKIFIPSNDVAQNFLLED